jgi:hypothetical protein
MVDVESRCGNTAGKKYLSPLSLASISSGKLMSALLEAPIYELPDAEFQVTFDHHPHRTRRAASPQISINFRISQILCRR